MEEWRFEPAHDFGLSAEQRRLSLRREVGLGERDLLFSLAINHAAFILPSRID